MQLLHLAYTFNLQEEMIWNTTTEFTLKPFGTETNLYCMCPFRQCNHPIPSGWVIPWLWSYNFLSTYDPEQNLLWRIIHWLCTDQLRSAKAYSSFSVDQNVGFVACIHGVVVCQLESKTGSENLLIEAICCVHWMLICYFIMK